MCLGQAVTVRFPVITKANRKWQKKNGDQSKKYLNYKREVKTIYFMYCGNRTDNQYHSWTCGRQGKL